MDAPATVPSERAHDGEGAGIGKLGALGGAAVEQELVVDLDRPAEDAPAMKKEEEEDDKEEKASVFPETSNNLTPAILRSRLNGKKLKWVRLETLSQGFKLMYECVQGKYLYDAARDGGDDGCVVPVPLGRLLVSFRPASRDLWPDHPNVRSYAGISGVCPTGLETLKMIKPRSLRTITCSSPSRNHVCSINLST